MHFLGFLALLLEIAPVLAGVSPFKRFGERPWTPARETGSPTTPTGAADERDDGLSPMPTEAARHPDLGQVELLKRYNRGSDTCGFAAGFKSEPWTCARIGAVCATTGRYMGCCAGSSPACLSSLMTTCRDYKSASSTSSSSAAVTSSCGKGTMCCGSTSPECFTWHFSTSASPGSTYSIFNCYGRGQGGTGTLLDAPPSQAQASAPLSTSPTKLNPPASDETTPAPTPDGGGGGGGAAPNNVAAIVGGVVGGLAVVGLFVVAAFALIYRRRRNRAPPPQPPASSMAGSTLGSATPQPPLASPPGGPAGADGTYYAFHQHPDNTGTAPPRQSVYGPGVYGYYAGEQKAPGQAGYDAHANAGPQTQYPQQVFASELSTTTTERRRHELG